MNEFQLIEHFFKSQAIMRSEITLGIGDDCAILSIPSGQSLLVSTDTLVSGVHFSPEWDPFDIAYKAVMVNISDCAAMAGNPFALTLALTLPEADPSWLTPFSAGLHRALSEYQISLMGGDLTRGPLAMTLTIHGLVPIGKALTRSQAQVGDRIYVSGPLGLPRFFVENLENPSYKEPAHKVEMKKALHFPTPRLDLCEILRQFATAAIDISDGLMGDLDHICNLSQVGALLKLSHLPIHPVLHHYTDAGLDYALYGGDEYELCFTIPAASEAAFLDAIQSAGKKSYCIGEIVAKKGIWAMNKAGQASLLRPGGYDHFG